MAMRQLIFAIGMSAEYTVDGCRLLRGLIFSFCCASSAMADAFHSSDVSDSEDNTSSHEFIIRQIAFFTEALEQNPADYTSRIQLIKFLRLKPDFEALEEQRNELASRFPLQDGMLS
jgi:hypothetical protein